MKALAFPVAGGTFTARLWPSVLTLIMLVVLLGLGKWQVERLHWKQNLIHEISLRLQMQPVEIAAITDPQNSEYRPVRAFGQFQPGQELYLHGFSLKGEGGYHVLSPLKLTNGGYLLVDRGWVPLNQRDPDTRPNGQNYNPTWVTGLLRLPHHYWMQPKNDVLTNDWYGLDLKAMADHDGLSNFLPYILEADATPNDGGYPLGGQTRVELPNNHFVYAFIWYSLAFALLVIYGVQGWKRKSDDAEIKE